DPRRRPQGRDVRPSRNAWVRAARQCGSDGTPRGRRAPRASKCGARRPLRAVQAHTSRPRAQEGVMRRSATTVATVLACVAALAAVAQGGAMTTFNFDSDTPGQPPKGFQFGLTGKGRPGKWIVQTAEDA